MIIPIFTTYKDCCQTLEINGSSDNQDISEGIRNVNGIYKLQPIKQDGKRTYQHAEHPNTTLFFYSSWIEGSRWVVRIAFHFMQLLNCH